MKSILSLLFVVLMLGGCATSIKTTTTAPDGSQTVTEQPGSVMGPSSYDIGYTQMYESFSLSKASRTASIMAMPVPTEPVANAYASTSKILAAALISQEKFDVKAPTTGFDVLNKLTDSVVPVAGFIGLTKLGVEAIKGAGSSFGNNATVSDSLNRTESNPVTTGYNNSVAPSAQGTSTPTVVEQPTPVIVDPSYAPVTTP